MIRWFLNLFKKKEERVKKVVELPVPTPPLTKEIFRMFAKVHYSKNLDDKVATLDLMFFQLNRDEIEDIGRKIYKVELDRRFSKENMLKELKEKYKEQI